MKLVFYYYLLLFLCLSTPTWLKASVLPTGFTESRLATKLDPTGVTVMPDGRVLVSIKSGRVMLVKNDVMLTTPFLTIANVDNWNERGLQTVVIDPGFATNRFIYAYYTYKNPNTNISNNRVSRFTINGDAAVPGSELVLLNFDNLSSIGWHNGGGLVFGADGKLYMATGENAIANNAQIFTSLLGKVLRINPDGTIPTDNPFYNSTSGNFRAIYALGFRNPFKMKIQPGTGKIFVNDVGASTWEEVNQLAAGRNYGWPIIEGRRVNQSAPANYVDPVYTYNHSNGNCSITGGSFYNPTTQQFPTQYSGKFFIMDYCGGWIRYVDPNNNFALTNFATGIDRPLDMAIDNAGNMYYLSRGGLGGGSDADNTSSNEGELWRVTYTGSGAVSITVNPQSKTAVVGGAVTFVMSASGAAPLQYQWKRNGVDIPGANTSVYTIPVVAKADNGARFSVVVSNATSTRTSTEAVLTVVDNTAPVVTILTPSVGSTYQAGTTFSFSGSATDAEDGAVPASAFTWEITLQHDVHAHPAMDPLVGVTTGSFAIPDGGETSDNVWFRITLTVTDKVGTKTTVFRDIFPQKADVTLATLPAGLSLKLDGTAVTTPYVFKGVIGIKRVISTDSIIVVGGVTYVFAGWSGTATGSSASTTITTSLNANVVANFKPLVANSYTLTTSALPVAGGTITRSPNAASYAAGTVVTLTATPATGYTFTGWSGGATGTAATTTVTINANTTVTANFTAVVANSYTLTTSASPAAGGTITRSPNAASYAAGTVVTLTATPATGYTFTGWSGGATGTAATTTVTINANTTVTANFTAVVANSYTLTTSASPAAGGTITRSPNAASYASGTVVTLTAIPATGYTFTGWSGGATGTAATTTVAINANTTVTANFTPVVTTTANIIGPDCGTNNSSMTFELNAAKRVNVSTYNWWYTGSAGTVTPVAGAPYSMVMQTGGNFSAGQVCVGTNLSAAPWYASYCKSIIKCVTVVGLAASQITISPIPSANDFTIVALEDVRTYTVNNYMETVLFKGRPISKGASEKFGSTLPSGTYVVRIQYRSGKVETKIIQKIK